MSAVGNNSDNPSSIITEVISQITPEVTPEVTPVPEISPVPKVIQTLIQMLIQTWIQSDPIADPNADPTADPNADPTVDPTADPTVDPNVANADDAFNNFYAEVQTLINKPTITASDLVPLAIDVMSVVQKDVSLSGPEKKQYVIDIMTKIVNESNILSPEYKADAESFLNTVLPMLIDSIINVYNREVNFVGPQKKS